MRKTRSEEPKTVRVPWTVVRAYAGGQTLQVCIVPAAKIDALDALNATAVTVSPKSRTTNLTPALSPSVPPSTPERKFRREISSSFERFALLKCITGATIALTPIAPIAPKASCALSLTFLRVYRVSMVGGSELAMTPFVDTRLLFPPASLRGESGGAGMRALEASTSIVRGV